MTLRLRILLALTPLGLLLIGLGIAGFLLLDRMGGRIDAILKENYASVQAMYQINEATERIDSSFQFALAGREEHAVKQFEANWKAFDEQFDVEAKNITIHPVEDDLVARLRELRADYRQRGQRFFALPSKSPERTSAYFGFAGDPGLLGRFNEVKDTANTILRINQENMEQARDEARAQARSALIAFGVSLTVVALLLTGIGWYLLRTFLAPIVAVTEAAHAIGSSGQLDRTVPVFGRDELGRLAVAFNVMTRELRQYRRSNLNAMRLMRKGARLADRLGAPWYAVYVQTPGESTEKVDAATERRLADSLTLAQQLDGIPMRFKGSDLPSTVAEFVREYGITHVVIGRSQRPWWRRWLGPSLVDRLIRTLSGIDLVIVDTGFG